jgi:hypothetical protein
MSSRRDAEADALPVAAGLGRFGRQALAILWPAFLMAGVLDALVFVVVDPGSLAWFGTQPIEWSRSAVYSVSFLIFWGVIATSGAITGLLEAPEGEG